MSFLSLISLLCISVPCFAPKPSPLPQPDVKAAVISMYVENKNELSIESSRIRRKRDLIQRVVKNHRGYAIRHGYDHYLLNSTKNATIPIYWTKVLGWLEVMSSEAYQWIFYLDIDAVIIKSAISISAILEKFRIADHQHFIFAGDTLVINSGVLLMRNVLWMKSLLRDSLRIGGRDFLPNFEQGVIAAQLGGW